MCIDSVANKKLKELQSKYMKLILTVEDIYRELRLYRDMHTMHEIDINDLSEELEQTKEVVKMIHKKTKIKTYAGMVNLKPEDIFLKKD